MFVIIDAINNIYNSTCQTCDQHLDALNNPITPSQVKPLFVKNLNTHLHWLHGMGLEVVETQANLHHQYLSWRDQQLDQIKAWGKHV